MKLLRVRWNSTSFISAMFFLVHVSFLPMQCASQSTTPTGATSTPVGATTTPVGATTTPVVATTMPVGATTKDITPPVASFTDCPPDNITNNPVFSYQEPTAIDQFDNGMSLNVSCNYPPMSTFPENNITTVICTAADAAGNVAVDNCNFTVTVDTIPPKPTFTACPNNIFTNETKVDFTDPTASEDDVDLIVTCQPSSGSSFTQNTVTNVVCTAADDAGNVAMDTCNFNITVDEDPPVWDQGTCPNDISQYADWKTNSTKVKWDDPTATDALDPDPLVTCLPTADTVFVIGTREIRCTAQDATGNQIMPCSFTVTVTELRAPNIDDITEVTSESMVISWTSSDKVETFTVQYAGMFQDLETVNQTVSGSETTYKLTKLLAGETYRLRVIAVSGLARAESDERKRTTDLNKPNITSVTLVTKTSMIVNWNPPPNSVVESYTVNYTGIEEDLTTQTRMLDGNVLQLNLDNLLQGETYVVKVIASSGSEEIGKTSAESQEWLETTVPENVTLEEVDSTVNSITARWSPPGLQPSGLNTVIEYYMVICESGQAMPSRVNYTSLTKTASCTNLPTAGKEYNMTIESHSGDKKSSSSIKIIALPNGVALEEGVPSTTSVSAFWSNPDGEVDKFNILCSSGTPDPPEIRVESPVEDLYNASCMDLDRPGYTYILSVYVESNMKRSNSSHIPLTALPKAVDNLSVTDFTTSTISLSWETCSICTFTSFLVTHNDAEGSETIPYESGTSTYKMTYDLPVSGREYTFSVIAQSGSKNSSMKDITQRTVPAKITEMTPSSTKTSITITWPDAGGDKNGYKVNIEPEKGTVTEQLERTATFSGLSPGRMYIVSVVTRSGSLESEAFTEEVTTEEDKPGPVSSLMISNVQLHSVMVNFSAPDEPNGQVTKYTITYSGQWKMKMDPEATINVNLQEIPKTIEGLLPGYTYSFMVRARNGAGLGKESVANETTLIKLPSSSELPPPRPDSSTPGPTTTTITTTFLSSYFSHDNGELLNYTIIIAQAGAETNSISSPETWFDVQNKDVIPPYQAFLEQSYPFPPEDLSRRRRRLAAARQIYVVIGNKNCESGSGYCNGPLRDDTSYVYRFRVWNEAGFAETPFSDPVTTVNDNSLELGLGLGLTLFVLVITAAVLLFLVIRKRRWTSRKPPPKDYSNEGYEHDLIPVRRKGNSRPVHLTDFPEHYKTMNADSQYQFSQEYEDLRPIGRDQSVDAALADSNRSKNRFTNILPYDHTRVKLKPVDDEEGSDYINANYMPGYNSPREFIACQGPLPGTENDLWRMVWEQKMSTIVMATQLVEKGRVKCHKYWPASDKPVYFGDVFVTLLSEVKLKHWTVREFQLHKGEKTRKVHHFNFTTWPDHGVPENPDGVLQFVRNVRSHIAQNNHPTLVHCSAGVGRTGTFICLDRLIQHMKEHDYVDIFGIVSEMRMHRNYMVQTEDQYIFIHDCVLTLLQGHQDQYTNGDAAYGNVTV